MFFEVMHPSWQAALADQREALETIEQRLQKSASVFAPPMPLVMRVFEQAIDEVKVLILGQDPYPTPGDAIGLAFAVAAESAMPRSLNNILRELHDDLGDTVTAGGDLTRWSRQGVFLLNRHLTVEVGAAGSHANFGWDSFTDRVLEELSRRHAGSLVAVLWGAQAKTAAERLVETALIQSAHPSPLSAHRGFFGSKPFSRVNEALRQRGIQPIDWCC
ncbi:MAG: uracil-DNA glycosylase [Microbacteriaceae bacterium]